MENKTYLAGLFKGLTESLIGGFMRPNLLGLGQIIEPILLSSSQPPPNPIAAQRFIFFPFSRINYPKRRRLVTINKIWKKKNQLKANQVKIFSSQNEITENTQIEKSFLLSVLCIFPRFLGKQTENETVLILYTSKNQIRSIDKKKNIERKRDLIWPWMMPPKRRRDSRRKNREDLEQILMLGFLCEEKLKIIQFKEKRKEQRER